MPMPLFCKPAGFGVLIQSGANTAYVASQLPGVPAAKRQAVVDAASSAASGQTYSSSDVIDRLATLAHWWQPTDTEATGVSIGSTVTTVTPYVGSDTLSQPTSGNRATFTSAGLQFNGTSNHYSAANVRLTGAGVTAFTLLTVAIASSATNYQSIFRFQDTSTTYQVFPWAGDGVGARLIILNDRNTSGPVITSAQLNLSQANILTVGWARNTANSFFAASNGIVRQVFNGLDTTLNTDTLTVGYYKVSPSEYFNGTIKTMAIAKRSYTTDERLSLERFFNFYNGLTIF